MAGTRNLSLEEMDRRGLFHPNTDLRAFAHGELGDPHIIERNRRRLKQRYRAGVSRADRGLDAVSTPA